MEPTIWNLLAFAWRRLSPYNRSWGLLATVGLLLFLVGVIVTLVSIPVLSGVLAIIGLLTVVGGLICFTIIIFAHPKMFLRDWLNRQIELASTCNGTCS